MCYKKSTLPLPFLLLKKDNTFRTPQNNFQLQITEKWIIKHFPVLLCTTTANRQGAGKTNNMAFCCLFVFFFLVQCQNYNKIMERIKTMNKNFIHRHLKAHFVMIKSSLSEQVHFRLRHKGLRLCIYICKLVLKFIDWHYI